MIASSYLLVCNRFVVNIWACTLKVYHYTRASLLGNLIVMPIFCFHFFLCRDAIFLLDDGLCGLIGACSPR